MYWLLGVFYIQLIFCCLFCVSPVLSGSSYANRGFKHLIEKYTDEIVEPFKPCETILKDAIVGDLIEFDRYNEYFNHWAIYIGDGKVADPFVLENIQITEIYNTTRALVLFTNLLDVSDTDECRINNKINSAKRRGLMPFRAEEIIKVVQMSKNKGFDYNLFESNCEHKVTKWKFGVPFSDQAEAVKNIANQTLKSITSLLKPFCDASSRASAPSFRVIHKIVENIVNEDVGQFLKPQLVLQEVKLYDIIEIRRSGYSHYAMYVGNGYVQHLSHDYNLLKSVYGTLEGQIIRENLVDVVANDLCRVNNKKRSAKRRGLLPREPKQIKIHLDKLLNTKIDYGIYSYNCEHIVTQWKFGKAFSDQVDALETIAYELGKTSSLYILEAYTRQTYSKHF